MNSAQPVMESPAAPVPKPTDHAVRKLDWIDGMRGLAVLMVIAVHCIISTSPGGPQNRPDWMPDWVYTFFHSGKYGVQLFFVVSAYTMLHSFYGRKGEKNAATKFFIRRYFRIAPMFYFGIILYYGFYWFSRREFMPLEAVGLTALFLHGFSPPYINTAVAGGWSIGVEFMFYALVPVLALVIRNLREALIFLAATLALAGGLFLAVVLYRESPGWLGEFIRTYNNQDGYLYFWLPNQLFVFAVGFVLFFMVKDRLGEDPPRWVRPLYWASLAGLLAACAFNPEHILAHAFLAAAFLPFCASIALLRPKWATSALIRRIGVDSFGIYIWHYAIKILFDRFLPKFGLPNDSVWFFPVIFLCVTGMSVLLADLTRRWVEDPGQALGRKLIKKLPS